MEAAERKERMGRVIIEWRQTDRQADREAHRK